MQDRHIISKYFAPRGTKRMYELGMQLGQLFPAELLRIYYDQVKSVEVFYFKRGSVHSQKNTVTLLCSLQRS